MFKNFISIFTVLIVVSMCGTAISGQTTTVDDNRAYLLDNMGTESSYVEACDPADENNVRDLIKNGIVTSEPDAEALVQSESKASEAAKQKKAMRPMKVAKPASISQ